VGEAALVRTRRFRSLHHYRRADWTPEQNRERFGAVAEPHSHDWTVTVTVRGPIDAHGFVVDLIALDGLLQEVVGPLDGADLNVAIPGMAEGVLQPSTEAVARWIWERIASRIPGPARLARVRVAESDALAAEYEGGA
jgi:6-pyruvoyltetrahydropterin/6-carboxytetrahydropterin synthase